MKDITFTNLLLFFALVASAQSVETRYYNKHHEEVPPTKATMSEIITQNADGTVTTTTNTLRKGRIVSSSTFRGDEPYGIWIYQRGSGSAEMDYEFPLEYVDRQCPAGDPLLNINKYIENNEALGYTAPRIAGGAESLHSFVVRNMVYPAHARRHGIQGTVYLVFNITQEGKIENVAVQKGVHLVLDKEAVRVVRKLKLETPPLLNGKPQDLCVAMPLSFRLN